MNEWIIEIEEVNQDVSEDINGIKGVIQKDNKVVSDNVSEDVIDKDNEVVSE